MGILSNKKILISHSSYPAHAKALPSSSTRMPSMSGMLNLQGGWFNGSTWFLYLLGWPIDQLNWCNFRGYRLTTNYIEPISFTVPRVKSTFFQVQLFMKFSCAQLTKFDKNVFQDDLFPPTRVLWQASCSGARWLAGELGAALWVGRLYSPLDFQSLQFLLD